MKVCIALCTYNGEKYLLEQLKSIESQTRQPDELVVCDDSSTDKTSEILYSFKEHCSFPVRIYENETNLGSTKNFEKAIRLCEGDVIALSDQDDVWMHDKLEKIVAAFEKNPDIGYIFTDAELVDENLVPLDRRLWESIGFLGRIRRKYEKGEQFLCLMQQHIVTGATMAFRSLLRELVLPFPTDTIWIHDAWIAIVASSIGKHGMLLPEPLILYRQHSSQQIGAPPPSPLDDKTITGKILEQYNSAKNVKDNLLWVLKNEQNLHVRLKQHLICLKHKYSANVDNEIEYIIDYIEQRNLHFINRLEINSTKGLIKIRLIFIELKSGRYKRFANSWLSAVRDLIILNP